MGVYKISPKAGKFMFTLHDDAGVVLLTSVDHPSIASAKLGIGAVRVQARFDGNYERTGAKKSWTFKLREGTNVIASGEAHENESLREGGIAGVKKHAPYSAVQEPVVA